MNHSSSTEEALLEGLEPVDKGCDAGGTGEHNEAAQDEQESSCSKTHAFTLDPRDKSRVLNVRELVGGNVSILTKIIITLDIVTHWGGRKVLVFYIQWPYADYFLY